MVTDVAAAASLLLLAWKICRTVKTHGSVVETTSRMLSKSILEIDSEICSEYIPDNMMSTFSKKRGSAAVLFLRLLIAPLPWPCAFPSISEAR
uniref:Secreted protein n=1 Tax=Zea mays TaxID=4577 RepID=B6SZE2_MAIZE|nr:hypothetical protein [Zea mays]